MKKKLQSIKEMLRNERDIIARNTNESKAINNRVLKTMLLCYILLIVVGAALPFFDSYFDQSLFRIIGWWYAFLIVLCLVFFAFLANTKRYNDNFMIYIVSLIGTVFSVVSSGIAFPDTLSVSFVFVLFLVATAYIIETPESIALLLMTTTVYLCGIHYFKDPEVFTAEAVSSISVMIISFAMGIIVRSARIGNLVTKEKLHKLAYSDGLTGLLNRRSLFEHLGNAKQNEKELTAFSIIDIDYFKKYNDTYGHQLGDDCLQKISNCMLLLQEKNDIFFYRYGGEEIVVLYYGYNEQEISDILKQLYKDIKQMNIEHKSSEFGRVTISTGTAFVDSASVLKYETLLFNADLALYKAKQSGRDQVAVYDSSMKNITEDVDVKTRSEKR